MRVFYDSNISNKVNDFTLSEEESKHIIKVLRLKVGDKIMLLNGVGGQFECEIEDAHPKKTKVKIVNSTISEKPSCGIHIAVGPTKQSDRIEWFVEKATEIGVTEITLIESKNSERSKVKVDRLLKKAISAMKQSQRTFLPVINELTSLKTFIDKHPKGLIAHCEDQKKQTISGVIEDNNCPILIGPEGDFTVEEIEMVLKSGYKAVSLGDNRLRTETAALFAVVEAKLALK